MRAKKGVATLQLATVIRRHLSFAQNDQMTSSSGAFVKPPAGLLDDRIYERYAHLPTRIGGKADTPLSVCLEYVWLSKAAVSGDPTIILSKTKVVQKEPKSLAELSTWIFDGVATQQAPGMDSECVLVPVLMAEDPFRLSPHKLVFCELRKHDGTPVLSNTRDDFVRALKSKSSSKPWWGIEQEVVIMDSSGKSPLGWPPYGGKPPRASVYCRTGVDVIGRKLMESLLRCCLYAGVNCSGINLECMPACIEWQVGPLEGVACADHLWLSRYILNRLAEDFGVGLSYAPKVLPDAAGSGLHTNFSTERMRAENGFSEILVAIDRLGKKHLEHMVSRYVSLLWWRPLIQTLPVSRFSLPLAGCVWCWQRREAYGPRRRPVDRDIYVRRGNTGRQCPCPKRVREAHARVAGGPSPCGQC